MTDQRYTASKSPTRDRGAWAISFRHPARRDPRGKQGLKIRRGLGTPDEAEAQQLVDEMNVLLADASWHTIAKRSEAEKRFAPAIVRAFYDAIEPSATPNSRDLRNEAIRLLGPEDGYARVMLVGPTGAGKTSLLRHLIGTDPEKERFPSTSAARTTISDTEVICAVTEDYEAVVTFANEWSVHTNVQECVIAACSATWVQPALDDDKVAEKLLNHRDLRFRMSYILGQWGASGSESATSQDDGWNYAPVEEPPKPDPDDLELPPLFDRSAAHAVLAGFLQRVRTLTATTLDALKKDLREDFSSLSSDDETAQEWFEEKLQSQSDFDDLVNDIIDEIRARFDWLEPEELHRAPTGWPTSWRCQSTDRTGFIKAVRRFSSNHAPLYGTLLTPVVDGIRVRGPFFPRFSSTNEKMVFIDGEGLGHAKDSAAGVPIHITRRYADVDVILLVDSAKAPMLEGPTSLIRSVAASGHQKKLAIAFTHFDALRGQANLPDVKAQRSHVMSALNQTLVSLRQVVALPAVHAIEREADERAFVLGFLDRLLTAQNRGPVGEIMRLFDFCRRAIAPESAPAVRPVYDAVRVLFAIQAGTRDFHERWESILGFRRSAAVRTAHWAEVKALNRRVVLQVDDSEYKDLRPVADLMGRLSESISKFLASPDRWEPTTQDEAEKERAVAAVQQAVSTQLHRFVPEVLLAEPRPDWLAAFDFKGYGSTGRRARRIQAIYETAAPIPAEPLDPRAAEFLRAVRVLVYEAIDAAGGRLVSEVIG